ncbi:MAG: sigma-70 family RNA polymerase sigma factor [Thermosynechococcaceae cyanobacterium MS004]|nr:sigma-70 family RNA polymerase sigma factor [Thermosynechococcaceae cyanobacterium MS004]
MPPDFTGASSTQFAQATDAELIQAVRAGDMLALGEIYDRHSRFVYGLALKMLARPDEAEELTQDIFLALWQRDIYDASRGSMIQFLSVLTRSRAMDRLRSRGSKLRFLERFRGVLQTDAPKDSPLDVAAMSERSRSVKVALADVPAPEREVLELAYFEGLSQSQIAHQLDIPLGTVKSRSRQGLQKLRQVLTDHR